MTTTPSDLRACPTCGIRRIVDSRRSGLCLSCAPTTPASRTPESRTRYTATWPILDDTRTLTDLAAEALDDLADLIDRDHHVMLASPDWDIDEDDHGNLTLRAVVAVRPVTYRTHVPKWKAAS